MSGHSSKATAALGAMSAALGPLGAEFGVLGASVSRASGIISNMTALAGGPWGIAIGAATAAVGLLSAAFVEAGERAKHLRDELEKTRQREAAQYDEKIKRQIELIELGDAENIKRLELEVTTRKLAEAELALKAARARSGEGSSGIFLGDAAAVDDTIAAELRAAELRAKRDELMRGGAAPGGGRKGGGGGGFRPSPTEFGTAEDLAADQARRDAELEQAMGGMGRKGVEDEILAEAERAEAAERMERERATAAELADMESAQQAERMRMLDERSNAERHMAALQQGLARDTLNIGMRSINELVKGHKVSAKQIVQSVGDALVSRGTEAVWQGHIINANPFTPGMGTPLMIQGGLAIGAGLAMGAASRAVSGGGGGGGGGSTGTPQLAPATPVQLSGGVGNQGPVTINVQMSSVVAPNGEDGERVTRALEEAKRQGRI